MNYKSRGGVGPAKRYPLGSFMMESDVDMLDLEGRASFVGIFRTQ